MRPLVRIAPALVVLAVGFAANVRAQESAGQTVVIPALPGMPNKEVRIAGQELANAEIVGPEHAFTGQVVQWEEGRSITMRFADGLTRVVPVASNIIFPPDLRPGGQLTVLARATADGRYKVTGLTTGAVTTQAPPAPDNALAPATAPATAPAAPATVAAPPMPSPPTEGPKGKTVVRASYITLRGTLKSLDKGNVTIVEKDGRERTLPLTEKAVVAEGLAPGDAIVVKVPLQKPYDGKSADRVARPAPTTQQPKSKFSQAQTPKS